MIKKIKELISNLSDKDVQEESQDSSLINNACAALLIEIAYADKDFDESEKMSLKNSLMTTYKIDEIEIDELILYASQSVQESTSLYGYTRIVNDEFSYDEKLNLLKNLWKIAYADGDLDKYEEHLIRKISDLIHVSHSDYINIKLEVRD
ncbi:MAG: TerB family tellurite resistance protein [SAR86 cluster bacterium]|nr:TerB family tellurite resistance protein [SAR86 cluster bacterium]